MAGTVQLTPASTPKPGQSFPESLPAIILSRVGETRMGRRPLKKNKGRICATHTQQQALQVPGAPARSGLRPARQNGRLVLQCAGSGGRGALCPRGKQSRFPAALPGTPPASACLDLLPCRHPGLANLPGPDSRPRLGDTGGPHSGECQRPRAAPPPSPGGHSEGLGLRVELRRRLPGTRLASCVLAPRGGRASRASCVLAPRAARGDGGGRGHTAPQ